MFYLPFRKLLLQYHKQVNQLLIHSSPDFLIEPDEAHAHLLNTATFIRKKTKAITKLFPKDRSLESKYGESGPIIHQRDVHFLISLQLPLVQMLNEHFPTESYDPIGLLQTKHTLLTLTIATYIEWKRYSQEHSKTWKPDIGPLIPKKRMDGISLIDNEPYLLTLFNNIEFSSVKAKQAVEYLMNDSIEKL